MPEITRAAFGVNSRGENVYSYQLKNKYGTSIHCLNYGASIHKVLAPNAHGQIDDLVLGFDTVQEYESSANQNFGGTIGRVAGRIKNGQFTLDGKLYELEKNWKDHHLHGGSQRPLDRVVWDAHDASEGGVPCLVFKYKSHDGEAGYPGNLSISITYTLSEDNEISINFKALTDQKTPVNLTNHTYWNLKGAGCGKILDHYLEIKAKGYLSCDNDLLPNGSILGFEKSAPLDFNFTKQVGLDFFKIISRYPHCKGIDHTFVLDPQHKRPVFLSERSSGRSLAIETDLPCIQVYTGNHLFSQAGKNQHPYQQYGGIALECQLYPDAVNQSSFPSCILSPDNEFNHFIKFTISNEGQFGL